jgi:hypothetical protein
MEVINVPLYEVHRCMGPDVPRIALRCFTSAGPGSGLVNMSPIMSPVGRYRSLMVPSCTWSFTKWYFRSMCLVFSLTNVFCE